MLHIYQPTYLTTPVDNLFIEEFMIKAPGEFVKVYLYGLRFATYPIEGNQLTCEDFAKALNIDQEVVINAFCYWDRSGIVHLVSQNPLDVQYYPVQQVFQNRLENRELYRYQGLNQSLQSLVGAQRLITHDEFQIVYEWVEQLGLEPEAVSLLVSYLLDSRHNKRLSFAYMDKIVRDLALQKGITTVEQIEQYIHNESLCKPARDVLALWNIHRNATQEEGVLWAHWTRDLGFDKQGILTAARHMSHISSPNFKYLNRILESLSEQGIIRSTEIKTYYEALDRETDRVLPVLRALGFRGTRTSEILSMASHWYALGFSQSSLEKMASSLAREGRSQPEDLDALVHRQVKIGKTSEEDIDSMLSAAAESRSAFSEILSLWGENRAPDPGERRMWSEWRTAGFSPELISLAAEYALKARGNRVAYMNAVLSGWKEQGVNSVEQAKKESQTNQNTSFLSDNRPEFERKNTDQYDNYFEEEEST